jgi:L-cysteine S-thiosulfotransferase
MRALAAFLAMAWLAGCAGEVEPPRVETPEPLQSGRAFLTEETRALQDDDFANPGYLWVDRGAALFGASDGQSAACSACHGEGDLAGAAATHPKWDPVSASLVNLEGRINACRMRHQDRPELAYESEDLLSLTAYVASLSRGAPVKVEVMPATREALQMGADYFQTRRGQFNLSCANCHDDNWGRKLRGDTISQGHGNAFPAYRLEWQTLGSLHRRFHDCDAGVRARPMEPGSDAYVALEYYLAVRASGLEMETPGVRR